MATPVLSILDPTVYDAVRAAVDPLFVGDTTSIPDTVIESPIYGPAAEAEVLAREAQVLPSQINAAMQLVHKQPAAIYLTAARLVQHFPLPLSQKLGDSSYTRAKFDPGRRHAALRTLAERELATYLEPTGYPHVLQGFWLAKGRRGA